MEKRGIITGATIQMNFAALGFDAMATLLISVESEQLDQVMDYIKKITEVRAYRQYNSIYNLRVVTTLKNINELDHVKEVIRLRTPANGIRTYIWTDVRNIPENLSLTTAPKNVNDYCKPESAEAFRNPKIKSTVDELDYRIIEELASNGRTPFSTIADELGTSTDTVVKRYRKLRQNNVIKVTIQINPSKIGYRFIMDFNISLKSPSNSQVIESLCKIPDIVIITKTSGDYDLQVTAIVKDVDQMFDIQDEIAKLSGVTKIETSARKIPTGWPAPKQYLSTF
jgi:Lrp/AsnC family transcriptional regulator for asnA, asnC and gidA